MALSVALAPDDGPRSAVTAEEFFALCAEARFGESRVELLNGVITFKMSQSRIHIDALALLIRALSRPGGEIVLFSQSSVRLGLLNVPEPDAALVRRDPRRARSPIQPEDVLLVAEVAVSSLRSDRATKAAIYAEAGIPEYWIVNPLAGQLEVYREPDGGVYRSLEVFGPGARLAPLCDAGREVSVEMLMPAPDED